MAYEKPVILAQSTVRMAECRPNSKPSGRPCNPPRTKRTLMDNSIIGDDVMSITSSPDR